MRNITSLIPAEGWYLEHPEGRDRLAVAAFAVIDEDRTDVVVPLVAQDDRLVQPTAVTHGVGTHLVHRPNRKPKKRG